MASLLSGRFGWCLIRASIRQLPMKRMIFPQTIIQHHRQKHDGDNKNNRRRKRLRHMKNIEVRVVNSLKKTAKHQPCVPFDDVLDSNAIGTVATNDESSGMQSALFGEAQEPPTHFGGSMQSENPLPATEIPLERSPESPFEARPEYPMERKPEQPFEEVPKQPFVVTCEFTNKDNQGNELGSVSVETTLKPIPEQELKSETQIKQEKAAEVADSKVVAEATKKDDPPKAAPQKQLKTEFPPNKKYPINSEPEAEKLAEPAEAESKSKQESVPADKSKTADSKAEQKKSLAEFDANVKAKSRANAEAAAEARTSAEAESKKYSKKAAAKYKAAMEAKAAEEEEKASAAAVAAEEARKKSAAEAKPKLSENVEAAAKKAVQEEAKKYAAIAASEFKAALEAKMAEDEFKAAKAAREEKAKQKSKTVKDEAKKGPADSHAKPPKTSVADIKRQADKSTEFKAAPESKPPKDKAEEPGKKNSPGSPTREATNKPTTETKASVAAPATEPVTETAAKIHPSVATPEPKANLETKTAETEAKTSETKGAKTAESENTTPTKGQPETSESSNAKQGKIAEVTAEPEPASVVGAPFQSNQSDHNSEPNQSNTPKPSQAPIKLNTNETTNSTEVTSKSNSDTPPESADPAKIEKAKPQQSLAAAAFEKIAQTFQTKKPQKEFEPQKEAEWIPVDSPYATHQKSQTTETKAKQAEGKTEPVNATAAEEKNIDPLQTTKADNKSEPMLPKTPTPESPDVSVKPTENKTGNSTEVTSPTKSDKPPEVKAEMSTVAEDFNTSAIGKQSADSSPTAPTEKMQIDFKPESAIHKENELENYFGKIVVAGSVEAISVLSTTPIVTMTDNLNTAPEVKAELEKPQTHNQHKIGSISEAEQVGSEIKTKKEKKITLSPQPGEAALFEMNFELNEAETSEQSDPKLQAESEVKAEYSEKGNIDILSNANSKNKITLSGKSTFEESEPCAFEKEIKMEVESSIGQPPKKIKKNEIKSESEHQENDLQESDLTPASLYGQTSENPKTDDEMLLDLKQAKKKEEDGEDDEPEDQLMEVTDNRPPKMQLTLKDNEEPQPEEKQTLTQYLYDKIINLGKAMRRKDNESKRGMATFSGTRTGWVRSKEYRNEKDDIKSTEFESTDIEQHIETQVVQAFKGDDIVKSDNDVFISPDLAKRGLGAQAILKARNIKTRDYGTTSMTPSERIREAYLLGLGIMNRNLEQPPTRTASSSSREIEVQNLQVEAPVEEQCVLLLRPADAEQPMPQPQLQPAVAVAAELPADPADIIIMGGSRAVPKNLMHHINKEEIETRGGIKIMGGTPPGLIRKREQWKKKRANKIKIKGGRKIKEEDETRPNFRSLVRDFLRLLWVRR